MALLNPETTSDTGTLRELRQFELDSRAVSLLDRKYCEEKLLVVLGSAPNLPGDIVQVGTVDATNQTLRNELVKKLGHPVELVQLSDYEIRHAISRMTHSAGELGLAADLNAKQLIDLDPLQPARKLVDDLLANAIRSHVTDIHFEAYEERIEVRLRLNGVLQPVKTAITPDNMKHVIGRLKVMARLDIAERRRPQDGSFAAMYTDEHGRHEVTFRISIVPGIWGEVVAIRVLDPFQFNMSLDELGMPPQMLSLYRKLSSFPNGVLLITGPTGSGKTTTLYCTVRELEHREAIKIMTIEDPIEYYFEKVTQTRVTEQMSFADALRAFLRQNADVLLVGEIRDAETAETSIRAATTGHLILSTVHTKDSISAIARMRVLQVSDDFLSSALIACVAQRLVRRICPNCKTKHSPSPELIASFYKDSPPPFFRGAGCAECGGTGYRGEIGIFELFAPDDELVTMIARGDTVDTLRHRAIEKGFRSVTDDALDKVRAGVTTLEEVARRVAPTFVERTFAKT